MNEEGAQKSRSSHDLQYINRTIPLTVHQEMMWGYAAMITFVDKQLGNNFFFSFNLFISYEIKIFFL
jgi:hypothetical protein